MNVFVLSTGRCGSMTFARACRHITNYSSAHESRVGVLGRARLDYPPNHIESDNRLSWFLGRLDRAYPRDVFYVHLLRDRLSVAKSYAKRLDPGLMMQAYARGIYLNLTDELRECGLDIALDYVDTVNANIDLYLTGRPNQMTFRLENARADFAEFWQRIGAEGDLSAACGEFAVVYNASEAKA